MDDRVCSDCGGRIAATDVACRHCGTRFGTGHSRGGAVGARAQPAPPILNSFFRILAGLWALTLPGYCTLLALTTPNGWGEFAAYFANAIYFMPWITGIISLCVLVWVTEPRR